MKHLPLKMSMLVAVTLFVCLMPVMSLENPITNGCGVDLSIWKKLVELEQEVNSLKNERKGKICLNNLRFLFVPLNSC